MFNRKICIILTIFTLLVILPGAWASDDVELNMDDGENTTLLSNAPQEVLTANNDYYFDASLDNDNGDGTVNNPYKYLTSDRIKANCNIHLRNGEYDLNSQKTIEQVNIIGENPSKTIINYDGVAFKVNNYLGLHNITLNEGSITNYATLNITNSIFTKAYGSNHDSYGNNFGGAIYTTSDNQNAMVTIRNSTFTDNFAVYGGAIYMGAGNLNIMESDFINNNALNYGGAIACENTGNVTVSKSKFLKNTALSDAGGAIYIKNILGFQASNVEFINSTASFGAAITTLNTNVELNRIKAINNTAKWEGGAIYHMYGTFYSYYGEFTNNTARNGGALYIDNSSSLLLRNNMFTGNNASMTGGAIFSILNNIRQSLNILNTFKNNHAANENNIYHTDVLNLTIGNSNYTPYNVGDAIITNLPSYYSLVREGQTTPVKDQQSSGNCWAFTAIAVLESCLKKITHKEFDLSEENMKNLIALYSGYGWSMDTNEGGYDAMPFGYFTSWLGPVLEVDDPFDDKSVLSPVLNSILHIQNILFLKRNNHTDNDEIKTALIKYGAVGTSIYMDGYYLNDGKSYYCWSSLPSNHAVTIVGWDDNYSRDNFKFSAYVPGDGAWIVKNSWGPYWGEDGYFYVSYYDESFAKVGVEGIAYTFVLNDTVRFDKNYQYDIAGKTDYLYNKNPSVWYKNRFTATDNEMLKGVSTYFEKITNWTVSVYVNNVLKSTKTGVSNAGYYTIYLDDDVALDIGDVFEVVFNTVCDGLSAVPISEIASLNKIIYTDNLSFISYDGMEWMDLYDYVSSYSMHKYYSQVACIKAFTVINSINTTLSLTVDYNDYNPVKIIARVHNMTGDIVNTGNVVFTIDGEEIIVPVIDGEAVLERNFTKGWNNVSASFRGLYYKTSYNSTSFNVLKDNIILDAIIIRYQNTVTLIVNASVNISGNVIVDFNGTNYTFKLNNGRLEHTFENLSNGHYEFNAMLNDSVFESDMVSGEFMVNVKNTIMILSDLTVTDDEVEYYEICLVDEDSNPVIGRNITVDLNNSSNILITDNEGKIRVKINLTRGDYDLNAVFEGDDSYFKALNSSSIKVKTLVNISLSDETYQNNAIINITLSKPISTTLVLMVNDDKISVNVTNGKAIISLSNLSNGEYEINSVLGEHFICRSNELKININVRKTQIIVKDARVNDTELYFTVLLVDEDGNTIDDRQIEFTLNNQSYSKSSGNAFLNLTLDKGSYTIVSEFSGDNAYFKSDNSTEIIIMPNVNAAVNFYNCGQYVIEVMLSKQINENATIIINDENYTMILKNGSGFRTLGKLENGVYDVTVLLDEGYNLTDNVYSFTVNMKNTRIIAEDFIAADDGLESYSVLLVDENSNALANQNIVFVIDGQRSIFANTDAKGCASFIIDFPLGEHDVLVKYVPVYDNLEKYWNSENSSRVTVKLNMSVDVGFSQFLGDVLLNVSFSRPINETINFTLNDEVETLIILNGGALINLTNLENNDYAVRFIFDGEKYYNGVLGYDFTVNVKDTFFVAGEFTTYHQSGENYKIMLVDVDGALIKNAAIKVIVDNEINHSLNTNDEGFISVPISLNEGNHSVELIFDASGEHNATTAIKNITVTSSITFTNTQYTLNAPCTILLKGNVDGKPVNLTINTIKYEINATGDKIIYEIGLNPGTYLVNITNPITGEVKTQTITVSPRLTDNKDITLYYGANKVFNVKVYDDNAKLNGAGELVQFKVNAKIYNIKTDKNGIASLKLNNLKANKYTVTVSYKGYSLTNKITVKKTLITKNKMVKKSKKIRYQAKLLNKNGKALKGKKITFKINGKKYTAKTNKKGIAKITIKKKLKPGKYRITAKYGKITSTSNLTIKK